MEPTVLGPDATPELVAYAVNEAPPGHHVVVTRAMTVEEIRRAWELMRRPSERAS